MAHEKAKHLFRDCHALLGLLHDSQHLLSAVIARVGEPRQMMGVEERLVRLPAPPCQGIHLWHDSVLEDIANADKGHDGFLLPRLIDGNPIIGQGATPCHEGAGHELEFQPEMIVGRRIILVIETAQAQNHEKVYALANEMLERVGQFMKKYQALGKALDNAAKAYEEGEKKLQPAGPSILQTCAKLQKLGAKASDKNPLPQLAGEKD